MERMNPEHRAHFRRLLDFTEENRAYVIREMEQLIQPEANGQSHDEIYQELCNRLGEQHATMSDELAEWTRAVLARRRDAGGPADAEIYLITNEEYDRIMQGGDENA